VCNPRHGALITKKGSLSICAPNHHTHTDCKGRGEKEVLVCAYLKTILECIESELSCVKIPLYPPSFVVVSQKAKNTDNDQHCNGIELLRLTVFTVLQAVRKDVAEHVGLMDATAALQMHVMSEPHPECLVAAQLISRMPQHRQRLYIDHKCEWIDVFMALVVATGMFIQKVPFSPPADFTSSSLCNKFIVDYTYCLETAYTGWSTIRGNSLSHSHPMLWLETQTPDEDAAQSAARGPLHILYDNDTVPPDLDIGTVFARPQFTHQLPAAFAGMGSSDRRPKSFVALCIPRTTDSTRSVSASAAVTVAWASSRDPPVFHLVIPTQESEPLQYNVRLQNIRNTRDATHMLCTNAYDVFESVLETSHLSIAGDRNTWIVFDLTKWCSPEKTSRMLPCTLQYKQ